MFETAVGSKYHGIAVGGSIGGSHVVKIFNEKKHALELNEDNFLPALSTIMYFSSSNAPYLSCLSANSLKIRNLRNDLDLEVEGNHLSKMTYSTFSECLFFGCDDSRIRIFDMKNDKKELVTMFSDVGIGRCVGMKALMGSSVCSLFNDGEVNIWDRDKRVSSFTLPEYNPRGLEYCSYRNLLFVTGYEKGTLKLHVIDPRSEWPVISPTIYPDNLTCPSAHDFYVQPSYFNTLRLLQNGSLVTSNCVASHSTLFFFDLRKVRVKPGEVMFEEVVTKTHTKGCDSYVTGLENLYDDKFVLLTSSGLLQVWNTSERKCEKENLLPVSNHNNINFTSLTIIPEPPQFLSKMPLLTEVDERLEREKVQVICDLKTKPLFLGGGLEKDDEEVEGEEDEEEEKVKMTLPGLFYIPEGVDEKQFYEYKNIVARVEDTILVRLLLVQRRRGDVLKRLLSIVENFGPKQLLEVTKRIKFLEADPILTSLILTSQSVLPSAFGFGFMSALEQKVLVMLAKSFHVIEKDVGENGLNAHFQKKENIEITKRVNDIIPFVLSGGIPGIERHRDFSGSDKDFDQSNPLSFYSSSFGMGRVDVRICTGSGFMTSSSPKDEEEEGEEEEEEEDNIRDDTTKKFRKPAHLGVLVHRLFKMMKPLLQRGFANEDLKKGLFVIDKCETELELNMLIDYAYGKGLISRQQMKNIVSGGGISGRGGGGGGGPRRRIRRRGNVAKKQPQEKEYGDVMSALFKFFWMAHSVGDTKMVLDVMLMISFMARFVSGEKCQDEENQKNGHKNLFEWFMKDGQGIPILAFLFGSVYDVHVKWILDEFKPLFLIDGDDHTNSIESSTIRIGGLFFEFIQSMLSK